MHISAGKTDTDADAFWEIVDGNGEDEEPDFFQVCCGVCYSRDAVYVRQGFFNSDEKYGTDNDTEGRSPDTANFYSGSYKSEEGHRKHNARGKAHGGVEKFFRGVFQWKDQGRAEDGSRRGDEACQSSCKYNIHINNRVKAVTIYISERCIVCKGYLKTNQMKATDTIKSGEYFRRSLPDIL